MRTGIQPQIDLKYTRGFTKEKKHSPASNVACNVSWRNARQYHHEEGQKKYCAAAGSFWPEARFWDFFGLKKAEGLLKAKKIPKTGRRPK